jgi:cyclophilin family peptidyl-prolyl cis-trans isomerase
MLIVKLYQKIILLLVCCTIFLSSCWSNDEPGSYDPVSAEAQTPARGDLRIESEWSQQSGGNDTAKVLELTVRARDLDGGFRPGKAEIEELAVTVLDPYPNKNHVIFRTSMGDFTVKLATHKAPNTVANFKHYVATGFYNGLSFHRVIKDSMVQTGGYDQMMNEKDSTQPPIMHEGSECGTNERGTLAMARMDDPHSATSQFFINVVDNASLNYGNKGHGYCAFGKVVHGMEVIDNMQLIPTISDKVHQNVPRLSVMIKSARLVSEDLVADGLLLDVVGVTLGYSASDDLSLITPVLSSGTTIPTDHTFTPRETLSTLHFVCQKPGNEPRLLAAYRVEHTTQYPITFDVDANGLLRVLSQGDLLGEPIPFYHQCL